MQQRPQPQRYFLLEDASCRILDAVGTLTRSVTDEEVDCGLLLLASACDHLSQQFEGAAFSCGFRNMQMLLSALQYEGQLYLWPLLQELNPDAAERGVGAGQPLVPDLVSIQTWLDHTWRAGFDADGAAQMGESVSGTDKWVGAGEAVSLFRSLGIPARPVVLHAFDSPFLGAALGEDAAVLGNVAQIRAAETLFATSGLSPTDVLEPWQAPPGGKRRSSASGGGAGSRRQRASSSSDDDAERLRWSSDAEKPSAQLAQRLESARKLAPPAVTSEVVEVGLTDSEGGDTEPVDGLPVFKAATSAVVAPAEEGQANEDEDDDICIVETAPKALPPPAAPRRGGPGASAAPPPARASPPPPPAPVSKATAVRRYSLARHATLVQWLLAYFLVPGRDPATVITSSPAELAAALRGALAGGMDRRVAAGRLPDGGHPLPLYFQHDGHSRTLIGLELRHAPGSKSGRTAAAASATAASSAALSAWLNGGPAKRPRLDDGACASAGAGSSYSSSSSSDTASDPVMSQLDDIDINLLLLDPSTASASLRQGLAAGKWGRFIRRNISTLRKPVYELVAITRVTALRAEAEAELGGGEALSPEAFQRFCEAYPALSKSFTQDHLFLG